MFCEDSVAYAAFVGNAVQGIDCKCKDLLQCPCRRNVTEIVLHFYRSSKSKYVCEWFDFWENYFSKQPKREDEKRKKVIVTPEG